ncbi:MAG TPA: ABC transporter permease [Firmicutes bacterium]|jgi:peptide/nickel transport system permease protein|nr:ABC transporter permease [Bacillota bacterium]
MKLQELRETLRDFWGEFRKVKYGMVGLVMFFLFLLVVIFEPVLIPFPETGQRWRDITYWEDNPKNAAPVWVNWFKRKDYTPQAVLDKPDFNERKAANTQVAEAVFTYDYKYDLPPIDLLLRATGKGLLNLAVHLERPDGLSIELTKKSFRLSGEAPVRLSLDKEAVGAVGDFLKTYEDPDVLRGVSLFTVKPVEVFFARAAPGILRNPAPLKGEYRIKLTCVAVGSGAFLKEPALTVAGRVFGLMGTDGSKRDIWSGVIVGTKWALLIGLLTSAVAVIIGVFYGVTSAYFGGAVDLVLMRIYEVFQSIPLLPVMIVVSAVFKPSIWMMILMMCAFFWVGSVRTVRSMGLQIKEETYVEAAHALGASQGRIIFKHMLPQVIPYAFASMALQVPVSIVYEASVSLLGLGDATIVTWGQILHDAMQGGAVLQGIWWWIIPPGLFIALMGMTFAFIGFAMDTILNPKLRTR